MKKRFSRLFAAVLAFALLFTCIPVGGASAASRVVDTSDVLDYTKPYIEGHDMWEWTLEQLPDTYSQTVVSQVVHRATYFFSGGLILPDSVSYRVTVDGKPFDDFSVYKKTSLGYGLVFCDFRSATLYSVRNPDPNAYTVIDFIGTDSAGYENHTYLKVHIMTHP